MKRSVSTLFAALVATSALVTLVATSGALAQTDDPCAGITGSARGLCNAYCNAQNCPAGKPGQSCDRLRANWLRQTGLELFPCDPVCCECPGGGRQCATVRRCVRAQCQIADRCINGLCPEPVCCECPASGKCDETTPRNCDRSGCIAVPGGVCTSTGQCEVCPCDATCQIAPGETGTCQPTDTTNPNVCTCKPSPPPPPCQCGDSCTDANGVSGTCKPTAANPDVCTCVPSPPPPPCQCGEACTDAAGVSGTCQPTDPTNPTSCSCATLPPPTDCTTCGTLCTGAATGQIGSCVTVAGANACVCSAQ